MDSNTHSTQGPTGPADELAELSALLDRLAARDLDRLPDVARAERVLALRRLADRLEGQWLKELAGVDARGAAGAEQDRQFGSTASWLRTRLRMTTTTAASQVRTARALFRGPLPESGAALMAGEISAAHAQVLATSTLHLPNHAIHAAEPTLLDSARCQDPTGLGHVVTHTEYVIDPDAADARAQCRYERQGVWFTITIDGMVIVHGTMTPEAGHTVQAALDPLSRPADHHDTRTGGQRTADALEELARQQLERGQLPKTGGVRPQLSVIVDLHSLDSLDRLDGRDGLEGRPGRLGGEMGWAGPLEPQACRRLACDATITRIIVSRHPPEGCAHCPGRNLQDPAGSDEAGWLRAVLAKLPPVLGGAPSRPLDVGRSTRVVSPAQRQALAVRDGGCVFPGCSRPLAWCEAHHVWHWLDGGATDLDNLALLCRAHHRAVHEGGWRLIRGPDGRFTATPPYRRHRAA
jgi:hypothetical protein